MLDLGLQVSKLGKSSATYEVGVFERGKENVRAVGGYTHVFVDKDLKRPAPDGMSSETRNGLEKLLLPGKPKIWGVSQLCDEDSWLQLPFIDQMQDAEENEDDPDLTLYELAHLELSRRSKWLEPGLA